MHNKITHAHTHAHPRAYTHTRVLSGARTRAPALALTPPNLCVWKGVADPSVQLQFCEPERVWLACGFPPGAREGPRSLGVAPALFLGPLSPPGSEGRRTKVSGAWPRDAPHSGGLSLSTPRSRRAARQGFPCELRSHPPDSQERSGRAAGRAEEPRTFPVLLLRHTAYPR